MTDQRIGILGYGRFGAALGGLLHAQGLRWRAWDTTAAVPAAHAAASVDQLIAETDLLIIAVPVPAFESVLRSLRPQLHAAHTVLDVGSVKEGPCAVMHELLGEAVPHVGTHPLFGPLSIARAEPLRTVICPNPAHPQAGLRVRRLFESVGCEVDEQSPSEHDRFMAVTHAMAFFIAKGLVDLGLGDDLRWAPPSFSALAASIAAVRADAGHLFKVIQRQNPYASEARSRFINALVQIDTRLAGDETKDESIQALNIPDLGDHSPALREVREHIEELDRELIALLRRRQELAVRADEARRELGGSALEAKREGERLRQRLDWASEQGLDPRLAQSLFGDILAASRAAEGG